MGAETKPDRLEANAGARLTKPRAVAVVAVLLFAGAVSLRVCREKPDPVVRRAAIEIPALPVPPPPAALPVERRAQAPPPEPPSADRLWPFLEKLGRAVVLRDRRTLDALRGRLPEVYVSDLPVLLARFGEDLFPSAGIAELARLLGWRDAVGPLAAVLGKPGRIFLKDVIVASLAALGGDAAEAALVGALQQDADDTIRLRSAAALSGFRSPDAYRCLILALRDPSPRVRSAAGSALARMNVDGTVDALLLSLGEERDPAVQAELVVSTFAAGGEATRETLTRLLEVRPEAAGLLRSRVRLHDDSRYRRPYDRGFFEPGAPAIPFDVGKQRIGITLEPGAEVPPREIALILFGASPLDRYRGWFYFRRADDFPSTKAYDGFGNPMEGVPYGEREGTVFLHFKEPASFAKGILGYTAGCHAFVQGASLHHEFGHAFAGLGDEYAGGSREAAANLFRQPTVPWISLVASSVLPAPVRRDDEFYVPSDNCYLNNDPSQTRYCAVCQLEIHARMAELAGATLPW